MKGITTIGLLILSNTFMTLAWYGHLKFTEWKGFGKLGLLSIILISWGLALFEYLFQVPANRIGYAGNGGPFSLVQLKVLQEIITRWSLPHLRFISFTKSNLTGIIISHFFFLSWLLFWFLLMFKYLNLELELAHKHG